MVGAYIYNVKMVVNFFSPYESNFNDNSFLDSQGEHEDSDWEFWFVRFSPHHHHGNGHQSHSHSSSSSLERRNPRNRAASSHQPQETILNLYNRPPTYSLQPKLLDILSWLAFYTYQLGHYPPHSLMIVLHSQSYHVKLNSSSNWMSPNSSCIARVVDYMGSLEF